MLRILHPEGLGFTAPSPSLTSPSSSGSAVAVLHSASSLSTSASAAHAAAAAAAASSTVRTSTSPNAIVPVHHPATRSVVTSPATLPRPLSEAEMFVRLARQLQFGGVAASSSGGSSSSSFATPCHIPTLCTHNARICTEVGRADLAYVWILLRALFAPGGALTDPSCPAYVLQDLQQSTATINLTSGFVISLGHHTASSVFACLANYTTHSRCMDSLSLYRCVVLTC